MTHTPKSYIFSYLYTFIVFFEYQLPPHRALIKKLNKLFLSLSFFNYWVLLLLFKIRIDLVFLSTFLKGLVCYPFVLWTFKIPRQFQSPWIMFSRRTSAESLIIGLRQLIPTDRQFQEVFLIWHNIGGMDSYVICSLRVKQNFSCPFEMSLKNEIKHLIILIGNAKDLIKFLTPDCFLLLVMCYPTINAAEKWPILEVSWGHP